MGRVVRAPACVRFAPTQQETPGEVLPGEPYEATIYDEGPLGLRLLVVADMVLELERSYVERRPAVGRLTHLLDHRENFA